MPTTLNGRIVSPNATLKSTDPEAIETDVKVEWAMSKGNNMNANAYRTRAQPNKRRDNRKNQFSTTSRVQ